MSEEDKVATARGFRPRSIRNMSPAARFLAEKRAKQEQSKAELPQDAVTEKLERFIQELAQELMNTYPPEKIADIAARQMIGADYFRSQSDKSDAREKNAIKKRMVGLSGHNARMKERRLKARARAEAIADGLWRAEGEEKTRTGEMTNKVYGALVDEGYADVLPGEVKDIADWFKAVKPTGASRPGPKKKSR